MLMKTVIIFLTILYLILTIVANYIYIFMGQHGLELSTKKFVKIGTIKDICRVVSFAVLIIDVVFILAFFF